MRKNFTTTIFLVVLLLVAPFTKAETIQIVNFTAGKKHIKDKH